MAIKTDSAGSWSDKMCYVLKMLGEYIDNCIRIFIVVFCADFVLRCFFAFNEYFYNKQYYIPKNRANKILYFAFSYNFKTICLTIIMIFMGLARSSTSGNLTHMLPSNCLFMYMPLYWIFQAVQLSSSTLDYSHWIRKSHGLDYASGMASNYFHGYLKLALPERNEDGLRKRMEVYEDAMNVTFALNRLIILIPDEMFVNGVIESRFLEKAEALETKFINRAGVNRPFKHAVYRLSKQVHGKTYYFVMEGATPMLSYFEAMESSLSATWQMKEMKREIWLKFCKHLKELLDTWPETRREVKLFIYNSHKPNGEPEDIGELLFNYVQSIL